MEFEEAVSQKASPEADVRLAKAIEDGANPRMIIKNWTGAMFLAHSGRAHALAMLLDAGVSVDAASCLSRSTAAMLAAREGNQECLGLLIQKGANIEAFDAQGWNPLMWAVLEGQAGAVRQLAAAGANIDARSALKDDVEKNESEPNFGVMLGKSARVEEMGAESLTALMIAAVKGDAPMVSLLMELGADPAMESKKRIDAQRLAAYHGHLGCMAVFEAVRERNILVKEIAALCKTAKANIRPPPKGKNSEAPSLASKAKAPRL